MVYIRISTVRTMKYKRIIGIRNLLNHVMVSISFWLTVMGIGFVDQLIESCDRLNLIQ